MSRQLPAGEYPMTATVHYWKVRSGLPVQFGVIWRIAGAAKPRQALKVTVIHVTMIRECTSLSSERPCSKVLHTYRQVTVY
jgi:hypothetical protein